MANRQQTEIVLGELPPAEAEEEATCSKAREGDEDEDEEDDDRAVDTAGAAAQVVDAVYLGFKVGAVVQVGISVEEKSASGTNSGFVNSKKLSRLRFSRSTVSG